VRLHQRNPMRFPCLCDMLKLFGKEKKIKFEGNRGCQGFEWNIKRKGVHTLKKFGISSWLNSPSTSEWEGFVPLSDLILTPLSESFFNGVPLPRIMKTC
jgi:hypothetical protein